VSNVQRFPQGLAELLALIGNEGPTELADTLLGTIELTPYYLARLGLQTLGAVNAAVNAPGNLAQIDVPANQIWLLVGGQATLQATTIGDAVRLSIGVAAGASITQTRIASQNATQTAANATARLGFGFTIPTLVLGPGNGLFAAVDDIALAAGNRSLTINALFFQLSRV
jgi:hypothetical protein